MKTWRWILEDILVIFGGGHVVKFTGSDCGFVTMEKKRLFVCKFV